MYKFTKNVSRYNCTVFALSALYILLVHFFLHRHFSSFWTVLGGDPQCHHKHTCPYCNCKNEKQQQIYSFTRQIVEFSGNSLTQTKQELITLYYLDCWNQIVQFDEQNKSLTKCTSYVRTVQCGELLFCVVFANFLKTQVRQMLQCTYTAVFLAMISIVFGGS